jgi:hypothetical protein
LNGPCFAKLAAGRYSILKERLTAEGWIRFQYVARATLMARNRAGIRPRMAYSQVIRPLALDVPHDACFMTFLSTAQHIARGSRRHRRSHMIPVMLAGAIAAGAIALVAYLLWPTWEADTSSDPARLPMSIGATLFNVPTAAIRMKIQRRTGPQERVDLSFAYPSLEASNTPRHVSAETVEEQAHPIDRIFVSIAAHRDSLAPEARLRTIYPRYFDQGATPVQDRLTMRAFRDGSPYSSEDLFQADAPSFSARCSRDAATPGMCLSERRINGADLTFRFPRSWLAQWREVANAMDRLTVQLHGPGG